MCDCKNQIEQKLLENFKRAAPEATDHTVELQGYGFAIVANVLTIRPYAPYKAIADFHLKKSGGTKSKAKTGYMHFKYCPYCAEAIGVKTQADGGKA